MDEQSREELLFIASVLTECFKSNVECKHWVQANPDVASAVAKAVAAMEEVCETISQCQFGNGNDTSSKQRLPC